MIVQEDFMAKKKIYAVRKGHKTGLFTTWAECQKAVSGYSGDEFRGFTEKEEALAFLNMETTGNVSGDKAKEAAGIVEVPENMVIAYVDGSFEKSIGRYAFGCVILTPDGQEIRKLYPQINRFTVDGAEVLMKHIGGYPGNYDPSIRGSLFVKPPKLFISGHSHILKVKYDKTLGLLHINPGAAGKSGFHTVRTLVRFVIDQGEFKDLEVIELADKL